MANFSPAFLFRSLREGFALWRRCKDHSSLMKSLCKRLLFSGMAGVFFFSCVSYRLADVMIISKLVPPQTGKTGRMDIVKKADIVDRNGELLATSLPTSSCYVDPSVVIDADKTAKLLSKIRGMPAFEKIKQKLADKNKRFVWLSRHITPQMQEQIMDLGLPGVQFQKDYKRVYIHGNLFSHVVGCSDIEGAGVCGLERQFSDELSVKKLSSKNLTTSLDLGLQVAVYEELSAAVAKYSAEGGNAILMASNGEILAMVSLPDFDSNKLEKLSISAMFNRNTMGAFEQGSILKILNVAIALDCGSAKLGSIFDASAPLKIGRFSVKDFKGKNRPLTLAEAFVFSSNIASARIAQSFGSKIQKAYMKRFGLLDKPTLEIAELGRPIVPASWTDATCMSVSYGYGLAVTPLQLLTAVTSIVNDGYKVQPTLLRDRQFETSKPEQLVSETTSAIVRDLMRAVVCFGTGKKAAVDGMDIFGKTGTAYKLTGRGYGSDGNRKRITTFLGGFPKDRPQYMLLVSLDNPKATSETHGYATAGWNIAPTARRIFERIIPLLHCEKTQPSEIKVVKYLRLD